MAQTIRFGCLWHTGGHPPNISPRSWYSPVDPIQRTMPGSLYSRYRFNPSANQLKLSGVFAELVLSYRFSPASLSLNLSSTKSRISWVLRLSETCALYLTRQCQGSLPFGFYACIYCATPDPGRRSGSVRPPCGFLFFAHVSSCHVAAHELNRRGPAVASPLLPPSR